MTKKLEGDVKVFTQEVEVPVFHLEIGKTIPMTYDVKGMGSYLESMLAEFIASKRQIQKPKDKSRIEEARFLLGEYTKFKLLESFGVKEYPIVNKK